MSVKELVPTTADHLFEIDTNATPTVMHAKTCKPDIQIGISLPFMSYLRETAWTFLLVLVLASTRMR